ncbi:MAG: aminodeoxychorismate lyase [Halomonas sp.]|uniref:aminodeoxychorismate lyase n=1 Tax=Halomonas sp. TaxID=1486246 RepID=UPI001A1047DD|nr:aminodeoxychorismate lyase [Halomonas sp.]MBE0489056.1 aminodeoxychorismate lyase [Halomonas sp.]
MRGAVSVEGWPLDDRGAAYGDGLFETVLLRDGRPLLWEEHLSRLVRGCHALGIPMPAEHELAAPLAEAGIGLFVFKLMLTRGSGGRGYRPPAFPETRLRWQLAAFAPTETHWQQGVRVRHCRLRLGIQPALAGLKHLNRLENVLARAEWDDDKVAEGLLCDSDGRLVEATAMNLFWQREGRLETPRLERCGVAGTLREALRERLAITEVDVGPEVLDQAEAVWLGNSVQGVWPVVRLDDPDGLERQRWPLAAIHRGFQAEAHRLLGYPLPDPT